MTVPHLWKRKARRPVATPALDAIMRPARGWVWTAAALVGAAAFVGGWLGGLLAWLVMGAL